MRNFFGVTIIVMGCFSLTFWMIISGEGTPEVNSHTVALSLFIVSLWMISLGIVIRKKIRDTGFHLILFILLTVLLIVAFIFTNITKSLRQGDKTLKSIETTASISQTIMISLMILIVLFFIVRWILRWIQESNWEKKLLKSVKKGGDVGRLVVELKNSMTEIELIVFMSRFFKSDGFNKLPSNLQFKLSRELRN